MQKSRILVVDDEEDVIRALQFRLETAGYETVTASTGAEALEILEKKEVDLVLADYMMPGVDGLELTRRVKQDPRWAKLKVVLFSCNADEGPQQRALEFGAVDYLSKMGGASSILHRVYEILTTEEETPAPEEVSTDQDANPKTSPRASSRPASEGPGNSSGRDPAEPGPSPQSEDTPDSGGSMAGDLLRLAAALADAGARRDLSSTEDAHLNPRRPA